jgi:HK97 family phage portal protein
MKFFDKIFSRFGYVKTSSRSQWDDFWFSAISALSAAGVEITPENALRVSAIWACNRVISESVASLPFIVYRRMPSGGKERAPDHPVYRIFQNEPNEIQTDYEYREQMQTHLNLYANAYSEIVFNRYGQPESLKMPTHPTMVKIEKMDDGSIRYVFKDAGAERALVPGRVFHLKGLSVDGYYGISPIQAGKDSIGLARAAELFGSMFFQNGARPSGVLKHPQVLTDKARDNLRNSVAQQSKSGTLILEEGMDWTQTTVVPEEAQFIETRQFQIEEVCRWYRMPPHKIAHLLRATFTNIEHQSTEFVTDTLMPHLKRWEKRASKSLFVVDGDEYFAEHLVEGLLRGDVKTRTEAYSKYINNGVMSPNEVRILENMNPRDGGDIYLTPMNMTSSNNRNSNENASIDVIDRLAKDAAGRIANAEINGARTEKFYAKHHKYIQLVLQPFGVSADPRLMTMQSGIDENNLEDSIYTLIMGQFNA